MKNIKKYNQLKKELQEIGIMIPGKLRTTYLRCGKSNCRCQNATKLTEMHGPYIFWDRRVGKKLSSMSIKENEVKEFEQWIQNRMNFERIVDEMMDIGKEIAFSKKNDR